MHTRLSKTRTMARECHVVAVGGICQHCQMRWTGNQNNRRQQPHTAEKFGENNEGWRAQLVMGDVRTDDRHKRTHPSCLSEPFAEHQGQYQKYFLGPGRNINVYRYIESGDLLLVHMIHYIARGSNYLGFVGSTLTGVACSYSLKPREAWTTESLASGSR